MVRTLVAVVVVRRPFSRSEDPRVCLFVLLCLLVGLGLWVVRSIHTRLPSPSQLPPSKTDCPVNCDEPVNVIKKKKKEQKTKAKFDVVTVFDDLLRSLSLITLRFQKNPSKKCSRQKRQREEVKKKRGVDTHTIDSTRLCVYVCVCRII